MSCWFSFACATVAMLKFACCKFGCNWWKHSVTRMWRWFSWSADESREAVLQVAATRWCKPCCKFWRKWCKTMVMRIMVDGRAVDSSRSLWEHCCHGAVALYLLPQPNSWTCFAEMAKLVGSIRIFCWRERKSHIEKCNECDWPAGYEKAVLRG